MNVNIWYSDTQTADLNGLQVVYKRSGQGDALFCIHGFPSSSWDFQPLWHHLNKRFKVIAHDLIGLGKSAKPKQPLTISLQADLIELLAIKEGITEAHILAHDMGDTIAQELLARQSVKTSKINWLSCVFLNGGLFPETHRALTIQKLLLSPLGPFVVNFMSRSSLKRSFYNIFSKAHPPTDEFIQDTWTLMTENNGRQMIPRLIYYIKERQTNRERWVIPMQEMVIPMRLINGIEDPVSGKHAAERYAELIPNADIVYLENSGHYPHIETPDEVLKAFLDFHNHLNY